MTIKKTTHLKLPEPSKNAGNVTFEENFNKPLLNNYMER